MSNKKSPAERLESAKQRRQSLNEKVIRAKTVREQDEKRLKELKSKAKELYGTDDLDELRNKARSIRAEEEQQVASFESQLDQIEADFGKIQQAVDTK